MTKYSDYILCAFLGLGTYVVDREDSSMDHIEKRRKVGTLPAPTFIEPPVSSRKGRSIRTKVRASKRELLMQK
ncbi:hypothetical protein CAAN1_04S00639 [[Candida] anglica]|uniref:Uncharacterized protein n=1 Tax=[Candida] anglica TaxID=148631 RepID=A0ABP0EDS2_9ASCO